MNLAQQRACSGLVFVEARGEAAARYWAMSTCGVDVHAKPASLWLRYVKSDLRTGTKTLLAWLLRSAIQPHGVREVRRPWLRGARPKLHCRLEPRSVIQVPGLDQGELRHERLDTEDRRPARRAEIPLRVAAVVLAGRRERGQRFPFDVERGARHAHEHRERAARLALAVRAVADGLNHRFGVRAVRHTAAQTSTSDGPRRISHADVTLQQIPCQRGRCDRCDGRREDLLFTCEVPRTSLIARLAKRGLKGSRASAAGPSRQTPRAVGG